MDLWKKYLLSTVATFAAPNEGGAGEGSGDAPGGDNGDNTGGNDGANGEGADGQDDAGEGQADQDDGAGDDDGEDDPFAGLTPEQRAKVERKLQRELEREVGWRDRQIDRLHRQKREAQEDNKTLTTIASRQPGAQQPPAAQDGGKPLTQAEIDRLATERAQQMTAQERYNQGLVDADEAGKRYYGSDWRKATDKLAKLGGVSAEDMAAILTTDNPAVVLHALSDPEEYERVMGLSGAKRNNAFVKIGLKDPPKRKDTEIREDIRPAGGSRPPRTLQGSRGAAASSVNLYDDKVNDDAWYEARNKERRKKFSSVQ